MTKSFPYRPAVALLLLAGCAPQADPPSLAPRAVEREFTGAPPPTGPCAEEQDGCYRPAATPEPPPVADNAALRARIVDLSAAATKGQTAFAASLPAANAAAAKAGERGSDSWVSAQLELSRLEALRAATADAVASLDALAIERAKQPTSAADLAALTAAADEARRISDTQEAEIARLRSGLSVP